MNRLAALPGGVTPRHWVRRDDNQQHYHGVLELSPEPVHLELRPALIVMPANPTSLAALDLLLGAIDRALRAGMQALDGGDAAPQLRALREEVVTQRDVVRGGGTLDAEWIRTTIRGVAAWAPESDVSLLGALGALARAR